jgi:general secretion pathway protein D
MNEVEYWVDKLDEQEPEERQYTLVDINHVDIEELADNINDMIGQWPIKANVVVQPLIEERKLMVIGSAEKREMVQQIIVDIDKPSEKFKTQDFELEYADPDEIRANILDLFSEYRSYERTSPYSGTYRSTYSQTRAAGDPDMVKVYAFQTLRQVTVMCSEENMKAIAAQIKKWDRAIDVNDVAPCIIPLVNSDPVQMAELLSTLFTETRRERSLFDRIFGPPATTQTIVGPLYGKIAFVPVEDTRKLVVISQVPEGYKVARELVAQLDEAEMAEVPLVIVLRYADPEDLAERLNATFNLAGQPAPIRRSERGLTPRSADRTDTDTGSREEGGETSATPEPYTPPWSAGRGLLGEMPISRVIGRIRFVAVPRSKAIMVYTPKEYVKEIRKMIEALDKPGKQVRMKAFVVEVTHGRLTSLGVQLATDPAAFGALDENAVTALGVLTSLATHGSSAPDSASVLLAQGSGTRLGVGMNVTVLVDFLVKRVDAKILNEQTLWTKDNEEALFFNGKIVAFETDISISELGGRVTEGVAFDRVGMRLRVRPVITPEKNVDMRIRLILQQPTSEVITSRPVRNELETETSLIVQDGETVLLGGMLLQEDSTVQRKVPLIGDLPIIGGLFRHNEIVKANNETLVFITPYVIDNEKPEDMLAETKEDIDTEKEKLKDILTELRTATEATEDAG